MSKGRITNNIRKLRFHRSEMTQQQLAEKVGVTRQTVIAMEGDKYSPSLEVAFRVAHAFGVPLEEVFQYEPEEKKSAAAPAIAEQPSNGSS
jgi:putative transcriptional regulator